MKVLQSFIIGIIILGGSFAASQQIVNAETDIESKADGGSYESNGKVSFYGEWKEKVEPNEPKEKDKVKDKVKVEDEEKGKTNIAGETEGSGEVTPKQTQIVKEISAEETTPTVTGSTPQNTKLDGSLPQTGMSTYFSNLGLLTLLFASYFILARRKKNSDESGE